MTDFVTMQTRIAGELRRSNLTTEIKAAINDAIIEASKHRFYFNEIIGSSFVTVAGQELYTDSPFTDIDTMYYLDGTTRMNIYKTNDMDIDCLTPGTGAGGTPRLFSRKGESIRLYPIPNSVITIYIDGFGILQPTPLVNNTDTNAWFTKGERYIRALAKSIILKDVIRDFTEAAVYEAIAEDIRQSLEEQTTSRFGTGVIQATSF